MQTFLGKSPELLRFLWSEASPYVRRRLVYLVALLIIASTVTALGPLALKMVVDSFAEHAPVVSGPPLLLIGLFVSSQFLARAVGEIRSLIYARAERRMYRTLSERSFGHLIRLPLRFHLERQTGAVNQTLANGLQGIQMILSNLVLSFLPAVIELIIMILVLIRWAPPILLALFCGAIVCYGGSFAYSAITIAQFARRGAASNVDANAAMTDGILNYETIKYFAAESIAEQKVHHTLRRTEAEWGKFYRRYATNRLTVAAIFGVFLGATTLYAARAVQSGVMTVGNFVLVSTYILQVVRPVEALGYAVEGLSQGMAMLEKIVDLFREKPEPEGTPRRAAIQGPVTLEYDDVWLSYRQGQSVLRGLSFKIHAGKTLGIVGSSGSGKSTTVRLLLRLLDINHGRILVDGLPINEIPLSTLRTAIAVVPQDTVLFNDSIAENIAFGKSHCTHAEVEQAAKLAHLHDFIMKLPERYDTRVGERGMKLSGGERQRISIARAAIRQPSIYVFDEATSSLDSRTERQILQNLREISLRKTTLIIAHRLSSVVHADEIVVLDGGTVVERGTHEVLARNHGLYAELWRAQSREPTAVA